MTVRPFSQLAGLALVAGLALPACSGRANTVPAPAADAMPVATATVAGAAIPDPFEAGGLVQARTTATLMARTPAPVREVRALPGDRVRAGQVLIVLNGRDLAAQARRAEAADRAARHALERDKAETAARVDVHVAVARLDAARASEAVGRDAVAQAHESRRIIRDRYEAGLTDVTSLLRSAEAEARAEAQQVAAQVAVVTASADLQRALGRR